MRPSCKALCKKQESRLAQKMQVKLLKFLYILPANGDTIPDCNMGTRTGNVNFRAYARFVLIFCCCLGAAIAGFGRINMKLLRAESGVYQRFAHDSQEQQHQLLRTFWTMQNHSHYIPIAFTNEFEFTRVAGMRNWLWRSRQIAALALVATLTFLLARDVARIWQMSDFAANSFAAGFAALLTFQPLMNELIAWPILFIHLIWISLVLFALWCLVTLVSRPTEVRWIWLAAISAYASMHFLGLGAVVVAATALIFCLLLLGIRRGYLPEFAPLKSQLIAALIFVALLGSAHALCMFLLPSSSPPSPLSNKAFHASVAEAIALITLYPLAIATSFGGVNSILPVNRQIFGDPWPFGILIAVAAIWIALRLGRAAFHRKTATATTGMILHVFATAALFGWIVMIGLRQIYETDRLGDYGFLVGPRYLVPASFLVAGILLVVMMLFFRRGGTRAGIFSIMMAVAAFWSHYNYDKNVYTRTPLLQGVCHVRAWRQIVAMARESRNAHLKIPDIPMARLTEGFDLDLRFFEPMLHDDLQLSPGERCEFIGWNECRKEKRASYEAAVPSLRNVIQALALEDPRTTAGS